VKIAYFGNGVRGKVCLEALLNAGKNICCVIVQPKNGNVPQSDITNIAKSNGIDILAPDDINSQQSEADIRKYSPDMLILSGYSKIIKQNIIDTAEYAVNLHGGRLPYYRGASTINWQIINGEAVGGCAVIQVLPGIDTGDIYASAEYEIKPDDNYGDVLEKTLELFPTMLLDVVSHIEDGTLKPVEQDLSVGAYYCSRGPEDGQIFWKTSTAKEIYNLIRSLTAPMPGAFTYYDKKKIVISEAELCAEKIVGAKGKMVLRRGDGYVVPASDGCLIIKKVIVDGDESTAVDFFKKSGGYFADYQ